MDPATVRGLNRMLGNPDGAATVEWALGAGSFRCLSPLTFALGPEGGALDGMPVPAWTPTHLAPGAELSLAPQGATRFSYLALAGGVDVEPQRVGQAGGRHFNGWHIILITGTPDDIENTIYLEPDVMRALAKYESEVT